MPITLWSVRPATDYQILLEQGVYTTDKAHIRPESITAYDWMAAQLSQKVVPANSVCYPVWAWYRYGGLRTPKPDLRKNGYLARGEKGVRIAFEVDESQILLSDFDGWHAVLNDHCFSLNDDDYEHYEKLSESLDQQTFESIKKETWLNIFDLALLTAPETDAVQAVLWELRLEQVKEVDFFTAR